MPEDLNDLFVNAIAASVDGLAIADRPARILISLSGGPDSTALLLAVHRFSQSLKKIAVTAAHVNHHLRGAESDNDEAFCRSLCECLNIPIKIHQDDGSDASISEDALRERRYQFLREVATGARFDAVMTGHTINDQAETILFRLVRGTSLKGLGGIKHSREFAGNVLLLRPLLSLSRTNIRAFLIECDVTAREDSSNNQQKYSRNFIRQSVLKPLEERFAGASERIAGFSSKAALDNDFIERQAEITFEQLSLSSDRWDLDELRNLHEALLTRIFALGLRHREIEIDSARIEALQSMLYVGDDYRISLDKTWDVSVDRNHIQWLDKEELEAAEKPAEFEVAVCIPGSTAVPALQKTLIAEKIGDYSPATDGNFPSAESLEVLVDLSKFESTTLILRRRRPGDFIQPLGMSQDVRLKKYLHTRKASRQADSLGLSLETGFTVSHCTVLACGQEVLWVPGIGLSEKVKTLAQAKPTHKLSLVRS